MSTSANKKATNPIDTLVFENGLRIADVYINKKLNMLLLILNNGNVLKLELAYYTILKKASQKNLDNWKLISQGIGIEWPELDEHLSLKGFLESYLNQSFAKQREVVGV